MKINFVKSVLVLSIGLINNEFLIGRLPFQLLHFDPMWTVISERIISISSSLLLIRIFSPTSFSRFGFGIARERRLWTTVFFVLLIFPALVNLQLRGNSPLDIFNGFLFALFIGIDEEAFDRGFVFGLLEKNGLWVASIFSSFQFGILHFGNYIWGGQSLSYTCGQVVGAASFGFLCVGLMLYSNVIWIPMLIHGITDFPMQLQSYYSFKTEVAAQADWVGTLVEVFVNIAVGTTLIFLSQDVEKVIFTRWLRKLGLTD
jgi:membrane protease YdiL (CAAX protease family)